MRYIILVVLSLSCASCYTPEPVDYSDVIHNQMVIESVMVDIEAMEIDCGDTTFWFLLRNPETEDLYKLAVGL